MRCLEIEEYCEIGPEDYDQNDVSPQTEENCIAYALGETKKPWWPSQRYPDDYDWPAQLPREEHLHETLDNFIRAFELRGYAVCERNNTELEPGVEKVAIYIGSYGSPTHASRQLESGLWGSKCGNYEDIKHKSPSTVEGKNYGKVAVVMRRPRV